MPRPPRGRPPRPLAACGLALALGTAAQALDLGPLASWDTDLEGRQRFRALGPLVEWRRGPEGDSLWAVRPLASRVSQPRRDRDVWYLLWPLVSYRTLGPQSDLSALALHVHDADRFRAGSRGRAWLLPFFFVGRDARGGVYAAVFPLGGTLRDFLGRDQTAFVLFPLYSFSTLKDLRTHDVLWPVFSFTAGEQVRRYRVFPLYGRATRRGHSDKRFVLWPFWTSVRYDVPGARGRGFLLFPLIGHIRLENQESWTVLPPFFRWSRAEGLTRAHLPWPFIQTASGDARQFYLWPFWGRRVGPDEDRCFVLWPFWKQSVVRTPGRSVTRSFLAPVLYSETRRAAPAGAGATNVVGRHVRLWPLFDYGREGERVRLRALNLWPSREAPPIEANWAPLWTLYAHRRIGGASEDELLWGLYRRRRAADGSTRGSVFPVARWGAGPPAAGRREWSLLEGLAGYGRDGEKRLYRLLYVIRIRR
jgi:hypothetical protein